MNGYVIGAGGIGGALMKLLPMTVAGASLALLSTSRRDSCIRDIGVKQLPCIFDSLTIVDDDVFEPWNAIRQWHAAGTKVYVRVKEALQELADKRGAIELIRPLLAMVKSDEDLNRLIEALYTLDGMAHVTERSITELRESMMHVAVLGNMRLFGINRRVSPETIADIIPAKPPVNERNALAIADMSYEMSFYSSAPRDSHVIFLCVDNAAARLDVLKYAETLENVCVIDGGNSITAGRVNLWCKLGEREMDKRLYEVYPDMLNTDESENRRAGCEQVTHTIDQTCRINTEIACIMLDLFRRWVTDSLYITERFQGRETRRRINEVLVDVDKFSMIPLENKPTNKKEED